MEKEQLWTIIAVSLVVAVVASIATASITGNFVKVQENKKGPAVYTIAETYSKAEVDAKLRNIGTKINYTEISLVLGTGGGTPFVGLVNSSNPVSCNQICSGSGGSCVGGIVTYKTPPSADTGWRSGVGLATCLEQYTYRQISSIQCRCINVPN